MKKAEVKRTYHRNGRLFQEVPFVGDEINGVVREWHKNGTLVKEVPMMNGLRHGLCKEWNEKGELLGTFEMNMGTGVSKHWFPNRQLQMEISVISETFTGRQREWDDDGTLVEEKFFLKNQHVTKEEYERACQTDSSLPSYASADIREKPVVEKSRRKKSERLLKTLLGTKKAEAIEWLKTNRGAAKKTLDELSARKSLALVSELYKTGAVKVLAVDIDESPKGEQSTDKLIVDLPTDAAKRDAIREWCAHHSFLFSPETDQGQPHLAIFLR